MMVEQRRVCPACGDTRQIRADGMTVECPLHDVPPMDSAASAQIRENILEHARRNPQQGAGAEPPDWRAVAGDPGRSYRAIGVLLVATSALVVLTVVITLVVLW